MIGIGRLVRLRGLPAFRVLGLAAAVVFILAIPIYLDWALSVRQLQVQTEQTALKHARRLSATGSAAKIESKPRRLGQRVEALPPGAVVAGDKGAVRVESALSWTLPVFGGTYILETSAIAAVLPQQAGGSRVAIVR